MNIKKVLLMAHGWSYDHTFFSPILTQLHLQAPELAESLVCVCLERGYFTHSHQGELMRWDPQGWTVHPAESLHALVLSLAHVPWIGLGHSMGFAHLLDYAIRWQTLVGISGFTHFCAAEGRKGVPPRLLKAMIKKLECQPLEVLKEFQAKAGWSAVQFTPAGSALPAQLPPEHPLMSDLKTLLDLEKSDDLAQVINSGTKVIDLRAADDQILPHGLDRASESITLKDMCHSGIATDPTRYTSLLLPLLTS